MANTRLIRVIYSGFEVFPPGEIFKLVQFETRPIDVSSFDIRQYVNIRKEKREKN